MKKRPLRSAFLGPLSALAAAVPVFAALVVLLSACSLRPEGRRAMEPERTEVTDMDLDTAREIIEPGDLICARISSRETVSREEFETFSAELEQVYPGSDANWQYMFFYNEEFENPDKEELRVQRDMFYPTIFHEGIEIVSARITDSYYSGQQAFLNSRVLVIREAFQGTDPRLEGWYREYIYNADEHGAWEFTHFGGQQNFMEPGMGADYLPLTPLPPLSPPNAGAPETPDQ